MKIYSTLLLFLLCFSLNAQSGINTARTSEALLNHLDEQPDGWHEVLIMLEDKVDVVQMDKDFYARRASLEERTFELITALKQKVATTQPELLNLLENNVEVKQSRLGRPVVPLQKGVFANATRTISLQHLPTGVYYLQINLEGKQAIRKVMKL